MRIAALMPERALNSIYRSLVPMQALAYRGHSIQVEEHDEVRNPEALLTFDLVHFMRFFSPSMVRMARRLKDAGVAVVWDSDADLAASIDPSSTSLYAQRAGALIASMVRCADTVTTPSEVLADRYRDMGAESVRVLENYLPPTFARPARVAPHPGVTIGWLATPEHQADFDQLGLKDALERLLARHPHLEVISIGLALGLSSRRYMPYPMDMYGQLPQLLMHFDIGIAPLADVPANHARSNIKLKEYAAMGVPWLASPVGPYATLGEEQGGQLVADDDWYHALERLVLDKQARSRLARRARMWAQGETIEHHVDQWEETFASTIERARAAHAVR